MKTSYSAHKGDECTLYMATRNRYSITEKRPTSYTYMHYHGKQHSGIGYLATITTLSPRCTVGKWPTPSPRRGSLPCTSRHRHSGKRQKSRRTSCQTPPPPIAPPPCFTAKRQWISFERPFSGIFLSQQGHERMITGELITASTRL